MQVFIWIDVVLSFFNKVELTFWSPIWSPKQVFVHHILMTSSSNSIVDNRLDRSLNLNLT